VGYKPGDFAASFGDIIGILMPGAVAAYVLGPWVQGRVKPFGLLEVAEGPPAWVAFVVAAYFLGHLVFLLGSFLDPLYNPLRKYLRPPDKDHLYAVAKACQRRELDDTAHAINVFKYAKAVLGLFHEGATAEIQRLEAESKFFRSICALLVLLVVATWNRSDLGLRVLALALILLSFWRYAERRWKSTELAYGYLVALRRAEKQAR